MFIKYMCTLLFLMVLNNVLGAGEAGVKDLFDKEVLKKGLIKGTLISIGFLGLYASTLIIPDLAIDLLGEGAGGAAQTLQGVLQAILWVGCAKYAKGSVTHLMGLIEIDVNDVVAKYKAPAPVETLPEETEKEEPAADIVIE